MPGYSVRRMWPGRRPAARWQGHRASRLAASKVAGMISSSASEQIPGGAPQYSELSFMNLLRRRLNDDGHFDPQHIGSGRINVLVHKSNGAGHLKHVAVECKVWRKGRPDPLPAGLKQVDRYLGRHGLDTGVLVIFDSRPEAAPARERSSITAVRAPSGCEITVLRA